jgi:hypothetical protein
LRGFGSVENKAEAKTKQEAIGQYWDHYHEEIQRLLQKYPDSIRKYETLELLGHKVRQSSSKPSTHHIPT